MEWTAAQIRALRAEYHFTQEELAEQVGVDARTVRGWEGNQHRPQPRHQRVLEQLSSGRAPSAAPAIFEAPRDNDSAAALRWALIDPRSTDAAVETPDILSLQRSVGRAWHLRQRADYQTLGRTLPPLLVTLQAHAHHDRVAALLVHAYNAASSLLKKLGERDLAVVAADRAVQTGRALDEPLLITAGCYRLANVFLPAGELEAARDVALSAASLLEPHLARSGAHLATWGALLLTAAVASAGLGDREAAWELAGEAKAEARQLEGEHSDLHAIFGPTSVAMHTVAIAVRLGDGGEALRRSRRVDLARLPAGLAERRSHFLVNLARAHAQVHDDARAVTTLREAEGLAVQEVRLDSEARALILDLLARQRRGGVPGLRELAERVGVAA